MSELKFPPKLWVEAVPDAYDHDSVEEYQFYFAQTGAGERADGRTTQIREYVPLPALFREEAEALCARSGGPTHTLKSWPEYFEPLLTGHKRFDLRRDDRNYRVGDLLRLREWVPQSQTYTGREFVAVVTYLTDAASTGSLAPGVVCLGIVPYQSVT